LKIAVLICHFGTAATALIAAWFWFQSATASPPMTYEGVGRFEEWLNKAAGNNRWAACFAGISGALAGLVTLLETIAGTP
jgi:hypothetical protein